LKALAESETGGELIGQTLAHFRIISKVGQGGMGVVYKAIDESLGRTVALKVLPPDYVSDEGRRQRLLQEARLAAAVTHANIAAVYEVGEVDGRVFVAMEYVEGQSLRHRLAQGPLSANDALRVARGIARGLAKAHEKRVIHRDLKPDNVMVSDELEVKVLDFGLAKLPARAAEDVSQSVLLYGDTITNQTQVGLVVGSPGYMAPEQAAGKVVGPPADVFSFGAMLYEMVTGQRAFKGETVVELIISSSRDTPPPASSVNPAVSQEVERLIGTCLAKLPESRFQNGREVLRELDRIDPLGSSPSAITQSPLQQSGLYREPVAAHREPVALAVPTPPPSLPLTEARRRMGPVPALVAAGVLLVAGAAFVLGTGRPPPPPPPSTISEAQALYAEALREVRNGVAGGCGKLARAARLEPTLAPAHLRYALCMSVGSPAAGRNSFQRAFGQRASLSEKDQALLDAYEPIFLREQADVQETRRRLQALTDRFPDDAEIATLRGEMEAQFDFHESVKVLDRALALDPKIASAWRIRGQALAYLGEYPRAFESFERCLALSPTATDCIRERINIHVALGACDKVEADARRWLAVEDDVQAPYGALADALYGQGKPLETVREVIRHKRSKRPVGADRPEVLDQRDLERMALLTGDFEAAVGHAAEQERLGSGSAREREHAQPALVQVQALQESGRPQEARKVAESFLARREAWEPEPGGDDWAIARDPTAVMLAAVQRSGGMTREALQEKRATRLAWWETKAVPSSRNALWIYQYAAAVETEAEAQEALSAQERYAPVPPYNPLFPADGYVGRTYLLAGRVEDALPVLERMTRSCYALSFPLEHTRAHYFLGLAREHTGDRDGACKAYGVVKERWGNARPRSVTAEKAQARMKALRCGR
jgi:serine/threonine-protein kinase